MRQKSFLKNANLGPTSCSALPNNTPRQDFQRQKVAQSLHCCALLLVSSLREGWAGINCRRDERSRSLFLLHQNMWPIYGICTTPVSFTSPRHKWKWTRYTAQKQKSLRERKKERNRERENTEEGVGERREKFSLRKMKNAEKQVREVRWR